MKTRSSTAVVLVGLALVYIRVNLTDAFLETDSGEAVGLLLTFVAICVVTIGGLLRLLECPHAETKAGKNGQRLTHG